MKKFQKFISVLVSLMLAMSTMLSTNINAETYYGVFYDSFNLDSKVSMYNPLEEVIYEYSDFCYADELNENQLGIYNQLVKSTSSIQQTSFKYNFTQTISAICPQGENDSIDTENLSAVIQQNLGYAFQAFFNEYPSVFWLSKEIKFSYSFSATKLDDGTYYVVAQYIEIPINISSEYGTVENANQLKTQYDSFVNSINISGSTRYEQLKQIQQILCSNITYNSAGIYAHSSAGAFLEPYQAVCEGYAYALKVLCDKFNIPCVIISGNSKIDNNSHMWCYIQMDNLQWYGVDPTWDDDDINNTVNFNYFLKSSDTFNKEHLPTQSILGVEFKIPALSASDYDPTQKWTAINSFNNISDKTINIGANETLDNINKILGTQYSINNTNETIDVKWECSYYDGKAGKYIFYAVPITDGYYVTNECNNTIAIVVPYDYISNSLDFTSATTNMQGAGYSWDNTSKTLILSGFRQLVYFNDGIKLPSESTLILNSTETYSDNIINCIGTDFSAIQCEGNLTIRNNVPLKITGNSQYGIVAKGDVVLNTANINVSGKEYGISCSNLNLQDSFLSINSKSLSLKNIESILAENSNLFLYSIDNTYSTPNLDNVNNTFLVEGKTGKIYGKTASLLVPNISIGTKTNPLDITIDLGQNLIIPTNVTANIYGNITNNGRVVNLGTTINNGTFSNFKKVVNSGVFTNTENASYITGGSTIDCNSDGILTVADMVLLRKYILDPNSSSLELSNIDINSDGRLSILDLLTLAFEITGKI